MARLKPKLHPGLILPLLLVFVLSPQIAANSRENVGSCDVPLLKIATVKKVGKDGILQMTDGEKARLIGILPVRLIENTDNPTARKLNRLARKALEFLRREVEGKTVKLHQSGRKRDRYDRLLVHVTTPKGQWLQGLLLRDGLARSFSCADNHACMNEMLELEAGARAKRRGLWTYHIFQPQQALKSEQLLRKRYRFTLVEGRINKVANVKKWLFLNFGDNWRNDFTIAIKRKYKRKIERSGLDLLKLQGKKIRVRGWIERWNGPLIKVTHKEQIEILEGE